MCVWCEREGCSLWRDFRGRMLCSASTSSVNLAWCWLLPNNQTSPSLSSLIYIWTVIISTFPLQLKERVGSITCTMSRCQNPEVPKGSVVMNFILLTSYSLSSCFSTGLELWKALSHTHTHSNTQWTPIYHHTPWIKPMKSYTWCYYNCR